MTADCSYDSPYFIINPLLPSFCEQDRTSEQSPEVPGAGAVAFWPATVSVGQFSDIRLEAVKT